MQPGDSFSVANDTNDSHFLTACSPSDWVKESYFSFQDELRIPPPFAPASFLGAAGKEVCGGSLGTGEQSFAVFLSKTLLCSP